MTISSKYETYLRHFGPTVTLRRFSEPPADLQGVALRHDVDHDIDVALEMAHLENRLGVKATYYVLHTAPYWQDPYLADKLLQLQDYGHEVGLHVNVLTEWMRETIDNPEARLGEILHPLRETGVRITGISAHGDALCYRSDFSNYWAFSELRPNDPAAAESGRTAEGVYDPTGERRLSYPHDHMLRRGGSTFPLWSVSMARLGLGYHAWHLPMDAYFSDSGGSWKRTPDPLGVDLSKGRIQILMHPIHWLGAPRTYFFLSPARAGTKWLAGVLNAATPLVARHEYMLNQEFHEGKVSEKPTSQFACLAENKAAARRLIADGWTHRQEIASDYAEVNVYLEPFVDIVAEYFPDASLVMVHRNPNEIVRSIIGRDWYDTPQDPRHRRVDVKDWDSTGQFARACYYVADVYARLSDVCRHRIGIEKVTHDLPALIHSLEELGIPVHPRLAARIHGAKVDVTVEHRFPAPGGWTAEQSQTFRRICGPIAQALGYSGTTSRPRSWLNGLLASFGSVRARARRPRMTEDIVLVSRDKALNEQWTIFGFLPAEGKRGAMTLVPDPAREKTHRHVVLGGSDWQEAARRKSGKKGWKYLQHSVVSGRIAANVSDDGRLTLFALGFGSDGKLVHRPQLGILSARQNSVDFSCRLRPDVERFDLALYAPKESVPSRIEVERIEVFLKPLPHSYTAI